MPTAFSGEQLPARTFTHRSGLGTHPLHTLQSVKASPVKQPDSRLGRSRPARLRGRQPGGGFNPTGEVSLNRRPSADATAGAPRAPAPARRGGLSSVSPASRHAGSSQPPGCPGGPGGGLPPPV